MELHALGISAFSITPPRTIALEHRIILSKIDHPGHVSSIAYDLAEREWPSDQGWDEHDARTVRIGSQFFMDEPHLSRFVGSVVVFRIKQEKELLSHEWKHKISTVAAHTFEEAHRLLSYEFYQRFPVLTGWRHHDICIVDVTPQELRRTRQLDLC